MKKIVLVVGVLLVVGIIMMNVLPINSEMATDSLEINKTYLEGSDQLVGDMSIVGNLIKEKTINVKTLLKEKNIISFKNNQADSTIECTVINVNGEKVFSKTINKEATYSFESVNGEGEVKLVLNNGQHNATIIINGVEVNNE